MDEENLRVLAKEQITTFANFGRFCSAVNDLVVDHNRIPLVGSKNNIRYLEPKKKGDWLTVANFVTGLNNFKDYCEQQGMLSNIEGTIMFTPFDLRVDVVNQNFLSIYFNERGRGRTSYMPGIYFETQQKPVHRGGAPCYQVKAKAQSIMGAFMDTYLVPHRAIEHEFDI